MIIYEYADCRVAEEKDSDICIIQQDFDFYRIPLEMKKQYLQGRELVSIKQNDDNLVILIIVLGTILCTLTTYFSCGNYILVDNNVILATLFLLINIPLHEIGHIIFLKLFSKDAKIRVGVTFFFIYPAFYVDTSYSYLCPKYKRMCIYLAGNFMNCIFLLVVYFFFPQFINYCYIIISNILVNFVPIIKSDGYYAMMTFLNKYKISKTRKEEYLDDFVRGLIMFIFMSGLSYIF